MKTIHRLRKTTVVALSALLFSTVGAAMAQESTGGPDEGQSGPGWSYLSTEESLLTLESQDAAPVLGVRLEAVLADAMLMERGSWRSMTVEEAYARDTGSSDPGGKEKSGFGRWMRKYWYIPAIVGAVLIGVELSDDDKGMDDEE